MAHSPAVNCDVSAYITGAGIVYQHLEMLHLFTLQTGCIVKSEDDTTVYYSTLFKHVTKMMWIKKVLSRCEKRLAFNEILLSLL